MADTPSKPITPLNPDHRPQGILESDRARYETMLELWNKVSEIVSQLEDIERYIQAQKDMRESIFQDNLAEMKKHR